MKLIVNFLLFAGCLFLFACGGSKDFSALQKDKNNAVDKTEILHDESGKQILPASSMPVGREVKPESVRMQAEEVQ